MRSVAYLIQLSALILLILCSSRSTAQNITSNLKYYFPFNGNVQNTITGDTGRARNGIQLTSDRNGNANSAYEFDGINDDIAFDPGIHLDDSNVVSISVQIKPDEITKNTYYNICRGGAGPANYLLAFQQKGQYLTFGINTNNGYRELDVSIKASDYTDGNWHCITGVYNGTTMYLYADGLLIGSRAHSGNLKKSSKKYYVGSLPGREYFDGKIDELRIYQRVLTAQDISAICTGGPTYHTVTASQTICAGDSVLLGGKYRTAAGQYTDTLSSGGSVDTLLQTTLVVHPSVLVQTMATTCQGAFFVFPSGDSSNVAVTDTSILNTVNGCDSVIITQLTINSEPVQVVNVTICQGQVHLFPNGDTSSFPMVHFSQFKTASGCDSIIETILQVTGPIFQRVYDQICEGETYTFPDGSQSVVSTIKTFSYGTINGCDSIVEINLQVNPGASQTRQVDICQGDTYLFPGGNESDRSMIDTAVFQTVHGCDSLIVTILKVKAVDTGVTRRADTLHAANQQAQAYQWIDCITNTPILGANGPSYGVQYGGSYALVVTQNGCSDTSACRFFNHLATAYSPKEQDFWAVYPNPTQGRVEISAPTGLNEYSIEVYDATGRFIFAESSIQAQEKVIDLSEQEDGLYLITMNFHGTYRTFRLIKSAR